MRLKGDELSLLCIKLFIPTRTAFAILLKNAGADYEYEDDKAFNIEQGLYYMQVPYILAKLITGRPILDQ